MESTRLPRFRRSATLRPLRLTQRDLDVLRQTNRHRFLRSTHFTKLLEGSGQQICRRLQLLFHHGYLDRPRCQLDYFARGGSQAIVYGLGNKGVSRLRQENQPAFRTSARADRSRVIGRVFLEHTLLVAEVMVALELACRVRPNVKLLHADELDLPTATARQREPFRWSVNFGQRTKLGLIPDQVFGLEFRNRPAGRNRAYYFLEADRATMPVKRQTLAQSSFFRKLVAYEATWQQNLHRTRFGFHRFRVLTVTSRPERIVNLQAAVQSLTKGHGLFLFAAQPALEAHADLLSLPLQTSRSGELTTLGD